METNFESIEDQWKEAEKLDKEFHLKLLEKTKELGVTIVMQIHDTIELSGPLEAQSKLLQWVKGYLNEHPR